LSDQQQRSQDAQRKRNQQQKAVRQRQAEEERNNFEEFEEDVNEVEPDWSKLQYLFGNHKLLITFLA